MKGREVRCITPAEPVTGPVPRRGCTRRRSERPANLTSARTRPTRPRYPTAVRPRPRSRTRTHARPADMMPGATTSVIAGPPTRRTPILRYVKRSSHQPFDRGLRDSFERNRSIIPAPSSLKLNLILVFRGEWPFL